MHVANLQNMVNGWFIGSFSPTLCTTKVVEVAVKEYSAGSVEAWHYHKIATEFTVIVSGKVEMNGRCYSKGDIIVIPPGEGTDFKALTHAVTTVVKLPGAVDDKYLK